MKKTKVQKPNYDQKIEQLKVKIFNHIHDDGMDEFLVRDWINEIIDLSYQEGFDNGAESEYMNWMEQQW